MWFVNGSLFRTFHCLTTNRYRWVDMFQIKILLKGQETLPSRHLNMEGIPSSFVRFSTMVVQKYDCRLFPKISCERKSGYNVVITRVSVLHWSSFLYEERRTRGIPGGGSCVLLKGYYCGTKVVYHTSNSCVLLFFFDWGNGWFMLCLDPSVKGLEVVRLWYTGHKSCVV